MNDSERARLAAAAPARAAELIADFMTRHQAWREQADDLARHRDEVRAAVEREAAALLAKARAEIRRTLVDTRRELLMLDTQLRALGEPVADGTPSDHERLSTRSSSDWTAVPDSITRMRRDLHDVIGEAQPGLEELATRATAPAKIGRLDDAPNERSQTATPVVTHAEFVRSFAHGRKLAIVLAAVGSTAIPVAGWRLATATGGSVHRRPSVAAAPDATPKPAAATLTPMAMSSPPPVAVRSSEAAPSVPVRQTWLWLLVEARRPAWIQATTDGHTDAARVLQPGETRRILANHSISIVVGDGGAVTLAFNGGQPATPGRDGQVVTRQFTNDDVEKTIAERTRAASRGALSTRGAIPANVLRGASADDGRSEIVTLSQRWLDGYYRRDNNTMSYAAAPDAIIRDERANTERLVFDAAQVDRTFDRVEFEQQGDAAVLALRMTEQGDLHGYKTQVVSLVSARWRRRSDHWRLEAIRIVADGAK